MVWLVVFVLAVGWVVGDAVYARVCGWMAGCDLPTVNPRPFFACMHPHAPSENLRRTY
jgi:hypothetical protein